jgi:LuxR family maltose regulon positive regulatory protein
MSEPLLTTKLHIPAVPPGLVRRPHLVARLDAGLGCKLTLISAPAGFGKTTSLSEWVHSHESETHKARPRFAWLSVDRDDNDRDRFWTYFIAALEPILADFSKSCLAMLETRKVPSIRAVLARLINEMFEKPQAFVLILDDYHEITTRSVHEDLAFLIDHLPPQGHLAIATRNNPPLPFSRLRGRGQLNELRTTDLRFTISEVMTFFNEVMALGLSHDNIKILESRTEGWIASLRMAALSMQGRADIHDFVKSFNGTHPHIEDYLMEEVVKRQKVSLQSFLMQTSILDRLSAPLCNAVTGEDDGQKKLEDLEHANLILPLDDNRTWFRYHRLFADLLHERLARVQPDLAPILHRRASEWFEREGPTSEAIHHALAAKDFDHAADMIESVAVALTSAGRLSAPRIWLSKLPMETIMSRPWLCMSLASVHLSGWQPDVAKSFLDATELLLSSDQPDGVAEPATTHSKARTHLNALRAWLALHQGNVAGSIRLCHQALQQMQDNQPMDICTLTFLLGVAHWLRGELAKATHYLNQAILSGQEVGDSFNTLVAMGHLADIQAKQGHLHQAAETCRKAIRLGAEWGGGEPLPVTAYAHICLAYVLYQWNEIDDAARYVIKGIELGRQGIPSTIAGMVIPDLAVLSQLVGQAAAVSEAFNEVKGIASASSNIMMISRMADAWHARLSLATGDIRKAELWSSLRKSPEVNLHQVPDFVLEFEYLTLVRLHISRGEFDDLPELLERLRERAEEHGRMGTVIEILVLQSISLQAQGRLDQAVSKLKRALSLAEPEGYVRIFVDEGQPMAELLRYARSRGIRPRYTAKLLALFSVPQHKGTLSTRIAMPPTEPLTQREVEVLQLLASGKSNRQIADELIVVTGTIKAHLLNIYGKLDVHSRTQALARSRQMGLL